MSESLSAELLKTIVLLIALALILLTVGWKLFKGDRFDDPAPAEEDPEALAKLTAGERYKLWREELTEWTNYDGSTVGLQELLDRWHGIPHDKPSELWGKGLIPPPPLPAGAGGTGALPPVDWANARKHMEAKLFSDERLRVGQWVRRVENRNYALKGGVFLVRILELHERWARVAWDCGNFDIEYADIEPAVPRVGEWWCWTGRECPERSVHHRAGNFQVAADFYRGWHEATVGYEVACGCLTPVNFGRGEEARG